MADDDEDGKRQGAGRDAALAVALNGASEEARTYLRKQSALADLEIDKLRKEDEFELSHLRWRRFNDQLRGALQIMMIAVGAVVVVAIAAALWNASEADGLVVDAFSVPPGFAQRGEGGDVIASDLTNHLAAVRGVAMGQSYSTASDVSKDHANDLSVEIPDTGVSLAEVWRALRGWLGHERHISGNLRARPDGTLVLTATLDGGAPITVGGSDPDALEQSAAEKVFCAFDQVGCFNYLLGAGRWNDLATFTQSRVAAAQTPHELSLAYSTAGVVRGAMKGDIAGGIALAKIGEGYEPAGATTHIQVMKLNMFIAREADVVAEARAIMALKESDQTKHLQGRGFAIIRNEALRQTGLWQGDFALAARASCTGECIQASTFFDEAYAVALQHDGAGARALIARAIATADADGVPWHRAEAVVLAGQGDWAGVLAHAEAGLAAYKADTDLWNRFSYGDAARELAAQRAVAQAKLGDFAGARATLAGTNADCYPCLVARGDVDAIAMDWGGADYWYREALRQAPTLPLAAAHWGAMLLAKGDLNGAIAKFEAAHANGEHYADPLEMWGEALMMQNRSDLALAKFEEAGKYAPRWGRLHLKWGEALVWSGDKDEARKQFAIASGLDLTPSEKAELARVMHG
jgi:tetratricopeptide (TPR) repeat protein